MQVKREFKNFLYKTSKICNTAYYDASSYSGILEGVVFKIQINDNNIFITNRDKNHMDEHTLSGFIEELEHAKVTKLGDRIVIKDYNFFDEENVPVYLEVSYIKPIDRLRNLLKHKKRINVVTEHEKESIDCHNIEPIKETLSVPMISDYMTNMKENKLIELQSRLSEREQKLNEISIEKAIIEKTYVQILDEIRLLRKRVASLNPQTERNGIFFNVSQSEKVEIEVGKDILSKLGIIFNINGSIIRDLLLYNKFIIVFSDDIGKNKLKEICNIDVGGIWNYQNGELVYIGDMNWHDIVQQIINIGYQLSSDKVKL